MTRTSKFYHRSLAAILGSPDRRLAANQEDFDRQMHEFRGERREPIEMAIGVTVFHLEMALLDIAEIAHPDQKLTA